MRALGIAGTARALGIAGTARALGIAVTARASGGCAPPLPAKARWSTPAGATALRCSDRGRTAELAPRPAAAALRQAAVSQNTRRAARAARGPVLLTTAHKPAPRGRSPHCAARYPPLAATASTGPAKTSPVRKPPLANCNLPNRFRFVVACPGVCHECRLPWVGPGPMVSRRAAQASGWRAQRASSTDSRPLFEWSGRRPRSEFGRAPRRRAAQ